MRNLRAEAPVEVVYAGLAPGMLGIYQVSVKMPARFEQEASFLTCRSADDPLRAHGGGIRVSNERN